MSSFFAAFSSYRPASFGGQETHPDSRSHHVPHSNNTTDENNHLHDEGNTSPPPFNPNDSLILEKEKWNPYKNALIFASSVLLWEKPVILIILSIFTHLVLWFGVKLITRSHYAIILGIFLWVGFVLDYMMKLSGNSWSNMLKSFPAPANPDANRDYDEIVHQYVTARRAFRSFLQLAKEQRKENHHQFTISALFFSLIFCTVLYFTRTFLLLYVLVFSCLLGPGLVKHNVPSRVWEFLQPHLIQVYQSLNSSLAQVLNPQAKPATPPPVNRPVSSVQQQQPQPPPQGSPMRPSQMASPYSGSPAHSSPLYRNTSATFARPAPYTDYPSPSSEYHSMPSGPRVDGSNRAPYSSDSHVSQRNSTHYHATQW